MRGRKKSDATRQAIVDCAAEVFSERDFHEVLTEHIAERLGIGKGTIYRYFRSKEELYLAAIASGLDGLHAAVKSGLEQEAALPATIDTLVRTMVTYFWRQRDFFVLLHRLEAKLDPAERAQWQARRDEVVRMVRRVLDRAAVRGQIRRVNSRLAVEALFGMIRGVCVYRADADRPEEVTRTVTNLFLGGLGVRSAAGTSRPRPLRVVRGGRST
jgi:TetR/AcrR family fatty acid metabolism transcriptional regulator